VAALLTSKDGDAQARGRLARVIYLKLSNPGFGASLALGAILIVLSPGYYFVETKFMHAKLTLALVVIALHHVIGGRSKRMADGRLDSSGATTLLSAILVAAAFSIVFLVVLKPF
jgi:putative membrane protein